MELTETQYYVLDRNYGLKIKVQIYKALLLMVCVLVTQMSFGQAEQGETIFGIQIKGVLPTAVLNSGDQTVTNDSIAFTISSPSGFSIGGIVRHNFTNYFTLETGIHFVTRSYSLSSINNNSGIGDNSSLSLVSYEIPVQWLYYIKLGEQFYMNTAFGVSFDIYPSDVVTISDNYGYIFVRNSWLSLSLIASVGFEYRTKNAGAFYLGASMHLPFNDIASARVSYFPNPSIPSDFVNLDTKLGGTYFSVDVRYFFKKTVVKKKQKIY